MAQEHFIAVGALAVIVLAVVFLLNGQATPNSIDGVSEGFSVLSVSSATFSTNNPDINSNALLMTTIVDGSSGTAVGTISPDIIRMLAGRSLESSFTLRAEVSDEACTYSVTEQEGKFLNEYGMGGGSYNFYTCNGMYFSGCSRYSETPKYATAKIGTSAKYTYKVKVSLIPSSGEEIDCTLSESTPSCKLGDYGIVKRVTSTMGAQSCPVPSQDASLIRAVGTTGDWLAVDSWKLNTALDAGSGVIQNPIGYCATGCPSYSGIDAANAKVSTAVSSKVSVDYSCKAVAITDGSQEYSCEPTAQVAVPMLSFILNADKLSITLPYGKPVFVSTPDFVGSARSQNTLTVSLRNDGDEDSFDVSLLNCGSVTAETSRVHVSAGSVQSVSLMLNGPVSSQACTLSAVSVNSPTRTASKVVNVNLLPPACPFECCESMPDYQDKVCPKKTVSVATYLGFHFDNATEKFLNDYSYQDIDFNQACQDNACVVTDSCGDGYCNSARGEFSESCAADCGGVAPAYEAVSITTTSGEASTTPESVTKTASDACAERGGSFDNANNRCLIYLTSNDVILGGLEDAASMPLHVIAGIVVALGFAGVVYFKSKGAF